MSSDTPSSPFKYKTVRWHAVYLEDGKKAEEFFDAPDSFPLAELAFMGLHPKVDYWELGR